MENTYLHLQTITRFIVVVLKASIQQITTFFGIRVKLSGEAMKKKKLKNQKRCEPF